MGGDEVGISVIVLLLGSEIDVTATRGHHLENLHVVPFVDLGAYTTRHGAILGGLEDIVPGVHVKLPIRIQIQIDVAIVLQL